MSLQSENTVVWFVEVQNKLEASHIPYQTDTGYSGMQNRMTGRFLGNIGQSGSHETIYYVYVSEENLTAAKEVIRRI